MADKLFFSYGRDEYVKYVLKVKEYLEKEGFCVFFDKEQLELGKNWSLKLEIGIEENDKFIFFITPHSCRHDGFCRKEISMAMYCQKEILPVLLKEHKPPLLICDLQYLDMLFLSKAQKESEQLFEERMQELIGALKGERKFAFKEEQKKVYDALQPIDFTQDFARHKRFVGREWVKDEVDKWIKEYKNSRVLWITADAGYGKSAIACHLSDAHPDVIGIHFCSYNYPNKNNPRNVIKTLAYHFQTQIDGYADEIAGVDKSQENIYELYKSLIYDPLKRLQPKQDRDYIVIIDGLDEAVQRGDKELVELIGSEFSLLPEYVKIIITSRPEPEMKEILEGLNLIELKADEKQNIEDCKKFIEVKLTELDYEEYIDNTTFFETLLERSEANMLYLTLFFDGVEKDLIDIDKPDAFPAGLVGIYKQFFSRITKDKQEFKKKLAPLLEVMVAYEDPIQKLLLEDILGLYDDERQEILTKLGSMVTESETLVDFFHKSLKDWLVNDKNRTYFISYKRGKERIEEFFQTLTPQTYKEEYLKLIEFNKKLLNHIYKRDDDLKSYFALLEKIKDDKKKIEMLNSLWVHFHFHNKMRRAIKIQEEIYDIVKPLYQKEEDRWAEDYTTALINLATSYKYNDRANEAIALEEESLKIRKELYQNNPDRWARLPQILCKREITAC